MIFKILVAVSILLNGIVIHLVWKRVENLEQWVMHLIKQTDRKENE